ncbi:hypothetical protein HDU97_005424 [Phlyctochytrium planicorne]|nr:hypothetical protein HDU97_005424 [Phlyctochytrium planicorne]
MVLEASVLMYVAFGFSILKGMPDLSARRLDNSEWMRNGDYTPTRMEAQNDAVTLLFNVKTQSNPENNVGLMTMAGKSPEVLVTLTSDIGKILTALHQVKISGKSNISTGVQIAQLVLKHRQNKNQKQRIIVFVGSPLEEDEKDLVKLGKKLKKNNVAVDVINFGEDEENTAKLEAFINAVNSADNSHLVSIPPGPHILSDVLISSDIVAGEDGAPPGFSSGGGYEFGVDPNLDPELALALRISMEEERARQEASAGGQASEGGSSSSAVVAEVPMDMSNDEDEMLAQALALSMEGASGGADDSAPMDATPEQSEEFMSNLLGTLPGVDPNDPRIRNAMEDASKKGDTKK